MASQKLAQLLAAARNEGNSLGFQRLGLRLDLILHLGIGE